MQEEPQNPAQHPEAMRKQQHGGRDAEQAAPPALDLITRAATTFTP